jgi:hypothetical protein
MGIVELLRSGERGITLELPEDLALRAGDDATAQALDHARGVGWFFYFFPDLHLDLSVEFDAQLRRDVGRHARYLFERMTRVDEASGATVPKLADRWSPLVSCERSNVDGSPALSILHRMAYRPGRETVMGHLLVPLETGLFEARWLVVAKVTGVRETALLMKAMAVRDDPAALLTTINSDDPKNDADFPDHPLTLARAAERRIREEAAIRITRPAPIRGRHEVVLEGLGCALVPPPRFVSCAGEPTVAKFHRLSIAGTDGVEWLGIERDQAAGALVDVVTARGRARAQAAGEEHVYTAPLASPDGLVTVCVESAGRVGPLRTVLCGLRDEGGPTLVASLATTTAQPADELAQELHAMLATYRRTA